ncbi:MAG TPA: 2,3-bisphosphoglycerate-independent phosphoglycerate mutase [Bryobacteraceae bacterium]|nr:2,3-bisphosphoglycerate-independent phosphoglycerate mutase [Bryobacteraceae bacterium]
MAKRRPVVFTILDGFGHSEVLEGNAVHHAFKPNFDNLMRQYPHTLIDASGPGVGLPPGQMGNSEVGHLNIGSGRIIHMDVTKIDWMILHQDLFENPVLKHLYTYGKSHRLHLMGLLSDGGVHSHIKHLFALLEMARREELTDVVVHCFLDGRDTPPHSGIGYLEQLQQKMRDLGVGRIGSVMGRYYAMDRDKRWERVELAYNALVLGYGEKVAEPASALKKAYASGVTDEFIKPIVIADAAGEATGLIRGEDAVFFFNFRADRAREITRALLDPALERPSRANMPKHLNYVTMTEYDKTFGVPFVVGSEAPVNTLGAVLSAHGLTNLRTAETEKYPHVTYFFNGGVEQPYVGEDRQLVASQKVATYDLMPEMSAPGVCDVVVKALESDAFDVIIVNFANPDMVGHTGVFEAAKKAVEACDVCLGRIYPLILEKNASWIVTADHGNAETMIDPVTKGPHTYHTTNPVPLLIASEEKLPLRSGGSLRDIAPTILGLLGIPKPDEMTGQDLRILSMEGAVATEPIQLHCDLEVDPAKEAEMVENFRTVFRPVISRQPGFVDVRLLKVRKDAPGVMRYRLLISFQTEEQRQTWVATEDHQRVWPAIEKTLTGKKFSGIVYDVQ